MHALGGCEMNRERSLKIVIGHVPLYRPSVAAAAGLTDAVALVLSTYRSDLPDMFLDYAAYRLTVHTSRQRKKRAAAELKGRIQR